MKILVGLLFIAFAIVNAWRTLREVLEGESHLVVSAAGDGLFGHADKSEEPLAFWFNIAAHGTIVLAAATLGGWIIFGPADF